MTVMRSGCFGAAPRGEPRLSVRWRPLLPFGWTPQASADRAAQQPAIRQALARIDGVQRLLAGRAAR